MKTKIEINPGICNFKTMVSASADKRRNVEFEFETECELIKSFDMLLKKKTPLAGLKELSPTNESTIMESARSLLISKGCCEACAVPIGVCKAMYVATGLALPADVSLIIMNES
ncbi:MAG: hypothetical protein HOD92_23295 [Deltaproteobacteria bacterium]|jgi:hypothetical protein|nr:hypothetical protein [Deltaproteobacteria bacterium]